MDWKRVSLVSVVVAASLVARQRHFFSPPPKVQISGADVTVESSGGRQQYAVSSDADFDAVCVGYETYRSGPVAKLGGRAIVSSVDPQSYAQMQSACARTGNCIATYLNERESRGGVRHLMLIPRDAAAMTQMRDARLGLGSKFQLRGSVLEFRRGAIDGRAFDGRLGNRSYFLVESLTRADD